MSLPRNLQAQHKYQLSQIALELWQGGLWQNTSGGCPCLHHSGNPRASVSSGQLQTMSEHHHPVPAPLILHRGQRSVLNGQSQSLQLIGLGKSLPLICQQQPIPSYKRKVYSAHMKGTSGVCRLGDRGGCAIGPYRTPTTLGHITKTWSQNSST